MLLGARLAWSLALVPSSVHASSGEHVLPERNDDRTVRATTWTRTTDWQASPPIREDAGGTRVAAMLSVHDGRDVLLQARGVQVDVSGACSPGSGSGPWVPMQTTFQGAELQVAVVDLDHRFGCAQIRMRMDDDARVSDLQWELVEPRYPDAGRASRELTSAASPPKALASELQAIGVVSREAWGARASQCSTPEDDWYRMAIHHTAGPQTADGSVQERLRGTQAYAMDSGGYCDIPYQMLVGYDGTLYEGRSLDLLSGATGGGNNGGNLAVCFIGCYHEPDSACVGGVGHDPTPEMMLRGQLLVQTLTRLHDISTAEDNIRGHRDWPGNSTACPGSLLHPRLGELRADLTWFAGLEVARSWDEGVVEVELGTDMELWVELENVGGLTWMPGETFLAPTAPRDGESAMHHPSWPSPVRAATVEQPIAPGDVGRFAFTVSPASQDAVTQSFGLVHEGTTWFADGPWGGGPVDDAIVVTVAGVEPVDAGTSFGTSTSGGDGSTSDDGLGGTSGPAGGTDSDGGDPPALPPAGEAADGDGDDGCGCSSPASGGGAAALWLLALAGLRRKRTGSYGPVKRGL